MGLKGVVPIKDCNCIRCGIELFGVQNSTKYCNTCSRVVKNENGYRYGKLHHQQILEIQKNWRRNNPEKKQEEDRRFREKYPEELKIRKKKYNKKYYSSEKGKESLHRGKIKRREKLNNIIHSFSYGDWLDKLKLTNGYCPKCKMYVGIDNLTLDHILPISKVEFKHIYTINDIQPLCKSCNCKKSDKL
ncbi:MAG: HNH endonuclease [Actinobacteria bacterium]|nr:HNH endonuclease [Actinomycetota bacterium]MBE3114607.1 HNH endonuclease [Actinomycetota bacterium]